MTRLRAAALLVLVSLVPLLGLPWGDALGDPWSELPVKLWIWGQFGPDRLFQSSVPLAFPRGGVLNNADPAGTLLGGGLAPWIGRAHAWNLIIWVVTAANLAAAGALGWQLTRRVEASVLTAVAFALTPLALVYGVASAVIDTYHLWPYPLAVRAYLRSCDGERGQGFAAGAWLGLGLTTCAYNAAVFSILAIPLLPWARTLGGGPARPWSALLRPLPALLLGAALVGAPAALATQRVTASPDSLLRAEDIEATRHTPPYTLLEPGGRDRYVATLADYVSVGPDALIVRDNGSRYYRAFSPGWTLILAAVYGAFVERRARPWLAAAAFAALASTGPFLPLTTSVHAESAVNPVWMGLHAYWPGASLLLEPFRYALPAALALACAAALGAAHLLDRGLARLAAALPVLWLVELLCLSPVPFPLPSTTLRVAPGWLELGSTLPPGAIVALPWYLEGEDVFNRKHFYLQLLHGRPIPDGVIGTVPRFVAENQLLASLLRVENPNGRLHVELVDPSRVAADARRLADAGFVAIVVDPEGYAEGVLPRILVRLGHLGTVREVGGIYVLELGPS